MPGQSVMRAGQMFRIKANRDLFLGDFSHFDAAAAAAVAGSGAMQPELGAAEVVPFAAFSDGRE
jgi:hypothetical protein